jgi:hypothetical protein
MQLVMDLLEIPAKYKVQNMACDRWYSGDIIERMQKGGLPTSKKDPYD